MQTDQIVLASVGSLGVAGIALFLSFFQSLLFLKRHSLPWNGWGAAISLSTALYATAGFFQYNTPANGINHLCELFQYTSFLFLIHSFYGYTFSILGIPSRKYHLRAGLFHLFLGAILWSTNLVIIDDFVFRRFLWLKLPYIEPDLGPLGPFFIGYCGIAALYSFRFWLGPKCKARSGSKVFILGLLLWLSGAVHDILATFGLIHTVQFLMDYGLLGFSVSVLVMTVNDYTAKALELRKSNEELQKATSEHNKMEELLRANEEAAKRLAQENSMVAEIGKVINLSLNIDEVYELFSEQVKRVLPYDRIVINLVNKDGCTLTNRYVEGVSAPGRNSGEVFPLAGTLTAEMIQNRRSFVFNSQDENEISAKYPGLVAEMKAGCRSFLSVPLISRDQPFGGLHFRSNQYRDYSEKDLKLAEGIAAQIAGAIANAQLFAELKRTEEDLRQARVVLEQKVQERTTELVEANKELRIEISERLRAEEELKIAKEGAESANRSKSDFLANMSHELRTPLNAIIGFSEILIDRQGGELNQLQDEYLRDVHQSSRHLLSLINDILDLSKVEAGKMELELAEVHLKPLLANSLVMIKERALKHGIQVQMEEDRLPATVQADERKIKQVLFNLLSNAVKFTPNQGVIRLQARAINRINGHWVGRNEQAVALPREATPELDGQKDWILISVADSGIGILPQDLERIFKPFEQADNSAGRQFQGTGLGLSLTKQLVELHGGRVWGESEGVEKGSKFSFVIPVDCRPANEKKG